MGLIPLTGRWFDLPDWTHFSVGDIGSCQKTIANTLVCCWQLQTISMELKMHTDSKLGCGSGAANLEFDMWVKVLRAFLLSLLVTCHNRLCVCVLSTQFCSHFNRTQPHSKPFETVQFHVGGYRKKRMFNSDLKHLGQKLSVNHMFFTYFTISSHFFPSFSLKEGHFCPGGDENLSHPFQRIPGSDRGVLKAGGMGTLLLEPLWSFGWLLWDFTNHINKTI